MDKQSVHLPEEIIECILSRLPVKSLLRFRCVSKSWGCLIFSKRFIKSHLQIFSSENTATDIAYHSGGGVVSPCSVESLMEFMRSSPFERPLETPVPGPNPVVGSCNGLVCIYSWDDAAFILFNPSMKIYNILPKIEYEDLRHYIISFGFGWDESSDDYKVVAFLFIPFNHRCSVCKVYSSKANSWKTVEIPGFDFIFSFRSQTAGKFLHGKLHWYLDSNEIVCFDLKSERIGMIECPDVHDNLRLLLSIGVVAGCLLLITREDNPDVCVMKEYGAKESWQILSHVTELLIPPFSAQFVVPPNSQTEIMLYDQSTFIVYHPCSFKVIESEAHIFIQSLVSPHFIWLEEDE